MLHHAGHADSRAAAHFSMQLSQVQGGEDLTRTPISQSNGSSWLLWLIVRAQWYKLQCEGWRCRPAHHGHLLDMVARTEVALLTGLLARR
jgi:hypothetical protein